MNLTPFLVLPVVSGYAFSIIWIGSLYHSSRESGHRLYFRAIFYAVFLVVSAICIHIIFFDYEWYQSFLAFLNDALNIKSTSGLWGEKAGAPILFVSFIIGPPVAYIINLEWMKYIPCMEYIFRLNVVPQKWQEFILVKAIRNNDFELMLFTGFKKGFPIMFTLNSGKVYVGNVVRTPNPTEQRKAIRITPLLSGYRDQNTQDFVVTTDYYEIISELQKPPHKRKEFLKKLSMEDFEVVFPSDTVCSSHLFDLFTYSAHFNSSSSE